MKRQSKESSPVISDTEKKLLELLVTGASSRSIAEQMGLKDGTTRVYLHTLYKRLGVNNKTSAVAWYLEQERAREKSVVPSLENVETFGDRAVKRDLLSSLGMMEVFLGPYGRMWDMLMQMEDAHAPSDLAEIRVRSRQLWNALVRGDFAESASYFDKEGVAKLFIESQSDAVVLAVSLLLGGYTARATKAVASLKVKRGGSIGITVDEKCALNAIGELVNGVAVDSALAAMHHLTNHSAQRPVFRHLLIVALFHFYKIGGKFELARDVADTIWVEAETTRNHLQSMGDVTFPLEARLPAPPRLPKAEISRYLSKLAA
jgi:DNA-binding CsgD family transcriptional regulator